MRTPIAGPLAGVCRWGHRPARRRASALTAAWVAASLLLQSPAVRAEPAPAPLPEAEQMTEAEAASLGCALSAAGAGLATVAAGGAALIAAEVGAASTAVAVPVLVATMAGACSLGSLATPAVRWLTRKGTALGSAVVRTVAKE